MHGIFSLSQLCTPLQACLQGSDVVISGVSTDTRTLREGDLFVALQGPNFDGHAFVTGAQQIGAVAALVTQPIECSLPQLIVADTRLALGTIAQLHRQRFSLPIVAVTGSCGKTTTKTLLANILKECGEVLATQGTLNNDIGVPLTLLGLAPQHEYAVIEMGANHANEIAYVTHLTHPNVAVITNAGPVHLEGFGDVAGVARVKGEIFQGLTETGIAVLNADDAFFYYWRELLANKPFISFGLQNTADVMAMDLSIDEQGFSHFNLQTLAGSIPIHLSLLGRHNVYNALAASAAALAIQVSLSDIKAGLENAQPVAKRMQQYRGINGALLIDDSYNANPVAFVAAIEVLVKQAGEPILVIGDMGELGERAEEYHYQLGIDAKRLGVQRLYAQGKLSRQATNAFGEGAYYFANKEQMIAALQKELSANSRVLIKGSRSARMEDVVDALKALEEKL
jgi:UDP-N-acetylmuramoyl-tripeptide--D-alanyl-D-alanine ligase